MKATKQVFFTDEKVFYTNLPTNNLNNRVEMKRKKS